MNCKEDYEAGDPFPAVTLAITDKEFFYFSPEGKNCYLVVDPVDNPFPFTNWDGNHRLRGWALANPESFVIDSEGRNKPTGRRKMPYTVYLDGSPAVGKRFFYKTNKNQKPLGAAHELAVMPEDLCNSRKKIVSGKLFDTTFALGVVLKNQLHPISTKYDVVNLDAFSRATLNLLENGTDANDFYDIFEAYWIELESLLRDMDETKFITKRGNNGGSHFMAFMKLLELIIGTHQPGFMRNPYPAGVYTRKFFAVELRKAFRNLTRDQLSVSYHSYGKLQNLLGAAYNKITV
jgi:hypothetical protein